MTSAVNELAAVTLKENGLKSGDCQLLGVIDGLDRAERSLFGIELSGRPAYNLVLNQSALSISLATFTQSANDVSCSVLSSYRATVALR